MYCAHCLQRIDTADRCPACAGDPLLEHRYRLEDVLLEARDANSYAATRVEDAQGVRACVLKLHASVANIDASTLDLPQLAHVHEIVREQARTWLIQARAPGHTLAEIVLSKPDRWREPVALLELIAGIADALAELHERGLTHAGISAETITVVEQDGPPRVTLVDPRFDGATHPSADVYALGLTLTQLLVGQRSTSFAPPPDWRERVSDGALVALLERMLVPNREQRITSATLREAVAGLLRVRGVVRSGHASPFLMIDPPAKKPQTDAANKMVGRVGHKRSHPRGPDIPVMRPDELSRELSQAHRAWMAGELRKRQQLHLVRALVVLLAATIAALATYIIVNSV